MKVRKRTRFWLVKNLVFGVIADFFCIKTDHDLKHYRKLKNDVVTTWIVGLYCQIADLGRKQIKYILLICSISTCDLPGTLIIH